MDARDFLKGIRNDRQKMRQLDERREHLRSLASPGGIRLKAVQVQESAPDDKMSRVLSELDAVETRLESMRREWNMDYKIACEVLEDIKDKKQRQLLELYYLTTQEVAEAVGKTHVLKYFEPLSWRDVSQHMHMPISTLHEIHIHALIAFDRAAYLDES